MKNMCTDVFDEIAYIADLRAAGCFLEPAQDREGFFVFTDCCPNEDDVVRIMEGWQAAKKKDPMWRQHVVRALRGKAVA